MLNHLLTLLKRPFPEHDGPSGYLKSISMVSIFVFLFLYILQPFELDQLGEKRLPYTLAFGAITFTICLTYEYVIKSVTRTHRTGSRHTFGYWLIDTSILILLIAASNYFFMVWATGMGYHGLAPMVTATLIVSFFPVVFIGAVSLSRSEKKHQAIADQLTVHNQTLQQKPPSTHELEAVLVDTIIYIESMQNYARIHYHQDAELHTKTIRTTLKSIEDQVTNTTLQRCHRSYIVNRSMIKSIRGNAQGLQLTMRYGDLEVPVSRRYVDDFRA